jgi:dTDP-4-dehydrorhamnose reductase
VTPYEVGELVAAERGYDRSLLCRGRMADLDRAAERPQYSCLDTSRLATLPGGPVPELASELPLVL